MTRRNSVLQKYDSKSFKAFAEEGFLCNKTKEKVFSSFFAGMLKPLS
jgi:hypothetical protein